MPKFRADFVVICGLVLPDDVPFVVIACDEPPIEITFRNAPRDAEGHVPELVAEVVGDCDSIEDVSTQFRELLANQLDIVSFATHSTFSIDQCLRVIDWEPFQRSRRIDRLRSSIRCTLRPPTSDPRFWQPFKRSFTQSQKDMCCVPCTTLGKELSPPNYPISS